MATNFEVVKNNVSTTVGTGGYTAGSGSLTLAAGGGALFPTLSAGRFLRVTVIQRAYAYVPGAPPGAYTIFPIYGITGDVLTLGAADEGTTDRNYAANDVVEMRITSAHLARLQAAINQIETGATTVDKSYVFNQSTPAATWSIAHGLNKYPSVSVVDSAGSLVVGDMLYVDANNVTVSFSGAFSGTAYMN